VEVDGVVLDAAVVGGEEFEGFLGDDGGFAIGSDKAVDGLEGGPQGFDDEVHDDAIGLRDDAGFAEAVEGAQVREDVFAEVAQIIGKRTAVVRADQKRTTMSGVSCGGLGG